MKLSCFNKKLEGFFNIPCAKQMTCFYKKCSSLIQSSFLTIFFLLISNPIWIQLTYFLALSLVGYLAFKVSKPRTNSFSLSDLDLFFTSVSFATVSSMSTVEMEVFSNTQLIVMTILMFMGGEVFISLLGLQLGRSNFPKHQSNYIGCFRATHLPYLDHHRIKLRGGPVHESTPPLQGSGRLPPCSGLEDKLSKIDVESQVNSDIITNEYGLKERSIKFLHYLTLAYILAFNICGSILVGMYISHVPSAKDVIISKGLQLRTFSIFTTVSSFANCGFIPTNENMMAFKSNPGLLLLLIPQILMGNTLYAPCLRFLIWVLEKTTNRDEFKHMLKLKDSSYGGHLLSGFRCLMMVATALGLISVQVVLFWVMEWNSEAMDGLRSGYEKWVSLVFQVVNARHAGESVFDLSTLSPAILVLTVVMMYLPPYTAFMPMKEDTEGSRGSDEEKSKKQRKRCINYPFFSHITYIAIFVFLICITERENMKEDPLNFSVFNITFEVISAYGNVGLSTGCSCTRQIKPQRNCHDAWYGLVGRWSGKGKFLIIILMFFGRLKKYHKR